MSITSNTVYYFFSTSAQVWAALVTLGGMALRDRILRAQESQDEAFKLIYARLSPHRGEVKSIYPKFTSDLFRTRSAFVEFFKNNGCFQDQAKLLKARHGAPKKDIDPDSYFARFADAEDYFRIMLKEEELEIRLKNDIGFVLIYGGVLIAFSLVTVAFSEHVFQSLPAFLILCSILFSGSYFVYRRFWKAFVDEAK